MPGKNTRLLAGYPLLSYAIAAAQEAGIFAHVVVSTDSEQVGQIARKYWANAPFLRPADLARDDSPDIGWVNHAINDVRAIGPSWEFDAFAIIRPTSPFRRGPWISQAWEILCRNSRIDSIRAMRECREHPAKMWRQHEGGALSPVLQGIGYEAPWHSMPTQMLPKVYTQTAALEIAWTRVLPGSISGAMVHPYYTEADAPEALDINTEADWQRAEQMAAEHPEWLPPVRRM